MSKKVPNEKKKSQKDLQNQCSVTFGARGCGDSCIWGLHMQHKYSLAGILARKKNISLPKFPADTPPGPPPFLGEPRPSPPPTRIFNKKNRAPPPPPPCRPGLPPSPPPSRAKYKIPEASSKISNWCTHGCICLLLLLLFSFFVVTEEREKMEVWGGHPLHNTTAEYWWGKDVVVWVSLLLWLLWFCLFVFLF